MQADFDQGHTLGRGEVGQAEIASGSVRRQGDRSAFAVAFVFALVVASEPENLKAKPWRAQPSFLWLFRLLLKTLRWLFRLLFSVAVPDGS